jgi:hypothetical protein
MMGGICSTCKVMAVNTENKRDLGGRAECRVVFTFCAYFETLDDRQNPKQTGGNCDTPSTELTNLYLFGTTYGRMAGCCEHIRRFSFNNESHTTSYVLVNVFVATSFVKRPRQRQTTTHER